MKPRFKLKKISHVAPLDEVWLFDRLLYVRDIRATLRGVELSVVHVNITLYGYAEHIIRFDYNDKLWVRVK